jgi:hypothetical protein
MGVAKVFAKELVHLTECKYSFIRYVDRGGKGIRTPDPLHAMRLRWVQ